MVRRQTPVYNIGSKLVGQPDTMMQSQIVGYGCEVKRRRICELAGFTKALWVGQSTSGLGTQD